MDNIMLYYNRNSDFSRKKLLIIAFASPWPPYSGGQIDIYGRINALRELGYGIELIITEYYDRNIDINLLCHILDLDACYFIKRQKNITCLLNPLLPYHISSRKSKYWNDILKLLLGKSFIAVVAEGSYVFPMSLNLSDQLNKPLLHRVHNIESKYFYNLYLSEISLPKKLFFLYESIRWKFIEKLIFKKAINLCISIDEFNFLESILPGRNFWLPPALKNFPSYEVIKRPGQAKRFLITASLSIPDNLQGVKWFLTNIWLQLLNIFPDISLTLVGRRPAFFHDEQYLKTFPNVTTIYDAPEIEKYFLDSDIYISPIFYGAGVKIKTVEALSYGLPLIATPISAQGCNFEHGKHLLIAETRNDFLYYCINLIDNYELRINLGKHAREYIKNNFNQKNNLNHIFNKLKLK